MWEFEETLPQKDKEKVFSNTEMHPGRLCPKCNHSYLDYDGLLNLVCPECGIAESGCFT